MSEKPVFIARRRGRPPNSKSGSASGQSQSLTRGLNLLERLAETGHGTSLTDLAQQVGLAPSTTHRLLNTLEQLEFVRQDPMLGLWHIGVKTFSIGNAFLEQRDMIEQSRPFMHKLMESTGETVNMAVREGFDAVFVAQIECHEMMRMIVKLGGRAPLHASGVGKALLASMSDADVTAFLHKRGLPRFTDNTLGTPSELRQALTAIQKNGYAVDNEEHAVGLCCVAATIHDENAEALAALSISGPKARVTEQRIQELGVQISQTADAITRLLGGRQPNKSRLQ